MQVERSGLPIGLPGLGQGPRSKSRALRCRYRGPRSETQDAIDPCQISRAEGRGPCAPLFGRGAGNMAGCYLSFSLLSLGPMAYPHPPPYIGPLRSEHGPWLLRARIKSVVISFGFRKTHGPWSAVRGPMRGGVVRGSGGLVQGELFLGRGPWFLSSGTEWEHLI